MAKVALGRIDEGIALEERAVAVSRRGPFFLGVLGDLDASFALIDRALEEPQAMLYYTGLPGFDPLRADPRFAAFLTRLGLSASA